MNYEELAFVAHYSDMADTLLDDDRNQYRVIDLREEYNLPTRQVKGVLSVLEDEGYAEKTHGMGGPIHYAYEVDLDADGHEDLKNLEEWYRRQL